MAELLSSRNLISAALALPGNWKERRAVSRSRQRAADAVNGAPMGDDFIFEVQILEIKGVLRYELSQRFMYAISDI